MPTETKTTLKLRLTVRQGVTVLPRCLQVLSRRGYILTGMTSRKAGATVSVLSLTLEGADRWHAAIPHLLSRIIDVDEVQVEEV
jgi:acetolactate synthase regulatory subunit